MTKYMMVLTLIMCAPAIAEAVIPEDIAVHCILGEARGDIKSLPAVAEALYNRGHTRGVYGCKVDFSDEMPYIRAKGIDTLALQAWRNAAEGDLVHGADHWENVGAFGTPRWASSMTITARIGAHVFFKRKEGGKT